MKPREFFPNMPDEVFDMWLAPFIKEIGWPFSETNLNAQGTKWFHIFGYAYPLTYWAGVSWRLVNLNILTETVSIDTHRIFYEIALHSETGANTTVTTSLVDSKLRFRACAKFINDNGVLPKPIIVRRERNGDLTIIDGNHRISAYVHVNKKNKLSGAIEAWMPEN